MQYSERKLGDITLDRRDVVRLTYPGVNPEGRQVVHVFEVELTLGATPAARLVETLAEPDGHVVQAAVIEPDPSQVPHSLINKRRGPELTESLLAPRLGTALVTWKVLRTGGHVFLRGAFVNARTGSLARHFNIAEWPGHSKTGDYSRIAFFYEHGEFNYFVPWIAESATGQRTLLAITITQDRNHLQDNDDPSLTD